MRVETITCDKCGKSSDRGRINTYYIFEPHGYRQGNAPLNRPFIELDMHDSCAKAVLETIETGWKVVIDAALKVVDA